MTQATLSVARLVPDGERMNFLPKAFGSRLMLRGAVSYTHLTLPTICSV